MCFDALTLGEVRGPPGVPLGEGAGLAEVTRELSASLTGADGTPSVDLLERLHEEHDGNLREAFFSLYDSVAG